MKSAKKTNTFDFSITAIHDTGSKWLHTVVMKDGRFLWGRISANWPSWINRAAVVSIVYSNANSQLSFTLCTFPFWDIITSQQIKMFPWHLVPPYTSPELIMSPASSAYYFIPMSFGPGPISLSWFTALSEDRWKGSLSQGAPSFSHLPLPCALMFPPNRRHTACW